MPGSAAQDAPHANYKWEGEPLHECIKKSREYCDWKAESMRANFLIHYHQNIKFELPRDTYEDASDFESCRDTSMALSRILPASPTIAVIGDRTGAVSISCWAQLTPERVVQVVYQDVDQQAVSDDNVAVFLRHSHIELNKGGSSSQTYPQYMSDHALWDTGTASSHSSHPWEYFKNLEAYWSKNTSSAPHKHFDLLLYENVWNRAFQKKLREIKQEMTRKSPEENHSRPRDSDLVNDLKFYDHETSPLEAMQFMDEFVMEPLFAAGATCDVVVCKIRGIVDDADWKTLQTDGSILALNYTLTFQIEELPNTRDNRMRYNRHTNSTDVYFEDHTPKYKDVNRGVRGKFHILIFQRNVQGQTLRFRDIGYRRRPWYGPFFCCCDATKRGMYVRTDTCEEPFKRISIDTELKVMYEHEFEKLTPTEQDKYFKVDALRRKIDVQIKDLTFLIETFKKYISGYVGGGSIPESTTRDIKKYIEQAIYTYKINDCVVSQSDAKDSPEQIEDGLQRIQQKTRLFFEVKSHIGNIMRHNKWTFPPDPNLPWNPTMPTHDSTTWHVQCAFPHLHSQVSGLDMDWTLGDSDKCYFEDGYHRSDYERDWESLTDEERERYRERFSDWDGTIRYPKVRGGDGNGHNQHQDSSGRTYNVDSHGRKHFGYGGNHDGQSFADGRYDGSGSGQPFDGDGDHGSEGGDSDDGGDGGFEDGHNGRSDSNPLGDSHVKRRGKVQRFDASEGSW